MSTGRHVVDCVIRDASDTGACLQPADAFCLPELFDLIGPGRGDRHACRVIGRRDRILVALC
jgi:hypothetical protein